MDKRINLFYPNNILLLNKIIAKTRYIFYKIFPIIDKV